LVAVHGFHRGQIRRLTINKSKTNFADAFETGLSDLRPDRRDPRPFLGLATAERSSLFSSEENVGKADAFLAPRLNVKVMRHVHRLVDDLALPLALWIGGLVVEQHFHRRTFAVLVSPTVERDDDEAPRGKG
jgi:hypothetical protein